MILYSSLERPSPVPAAPIRDSFDPPAAISNSPDDARRQRFSQPGDSSRPSPSLVPERQRRRRPTFLRHGWQSALDRVPVFRELDEVRRAVTRQTLVLPGSRRGPAVVSTILSSFPATRYPGPGTAIYLFARSVSSSGSMMGARVIRFEGRSPDRKGAKVKVRPVRSKLHERLHDARGRHSCHLLAEPYRPPGRHPSARDPPTPRPTGVISSTPFNVSFPPGALLFSFSLVPLRSTLRPLVP